MDGQILRSSTPDGLAPMSFMALEIFTFSFAGLAIIWGVLNFLQLLRIGPEVQEEGMISSSGQTQQVRELGLKVLMESLHYMKFNGIAVLVASLVYFLIILGAVENWNETGSSLDYLYGMLAASLTAVFIVVTTSFSYFRIVYQAKYSAEDAFKATKTTSNAVTFVSIGIILASIMGIIIRANPENKSQEDQINHCADTVIAFAFGYVTVAICTKITSLIYSKGI